VCFVVYSEWYETRDALSHFRCALLDGAVSNVKHIQQIKVTRTEILTAVKKSMFVFWVVKPRGLLGRH
jgi:hypothetical protein